MIQRVHHGFSPRQDLSPDEFKTLSRKPITQLSDEELWRVYEARSVYLGDSTSTGTCLGCSLCEKRHG